MKIIDSHIHAEFSDVWMIEAANVSGANYTQKGLQEEMSANNISSVLAIGLKSEDGNASTVAETPMLPEVSDSINSAVKIAGINPYKSGRKNLSETEKLIKNGTVKGLKVYLGYYPFYPYDKIYFPYYNLASKYNIPVIFHTGDTYAPNALVKYAHPLGIDEVAVKFRNVNFILSHFGNPWMFDTAELLFKNKNVYADLSGLIVGDMRNISGVNAKMLKEALEWVGDYEKILYGSDWPIVSMKGYINFIKKIIPKKYWEKVFYLNSKRVFNL